MPIDIKAVGLNQRERLTMAFGYGATRLTAAATAATTTTLNVVDDFGDVLTAYTNSDPVFIKGQDGRREIKALASSNAISTTAKTLTLSTAVLYAHAIGTEVWKLVTPGGATLRYAYESQWRSGQYTQKTLALAELTVASTGILYYDIDLTEVGTFKWWFFGTSTVLGADDGVNEIEVLPALG